MLIPDYIQKSQVFSLLLLTQPVPATPSSYSLIRKNAGFDTGRNKTKIDVNSFERISALVRQRTRADLNEGVN